MSQERWEGKTQTLVEGSELSGEFPDTFSLGPCRSWSRGWLGEPG